MDRNDKPEPLVTAGCCMPADQRPQMDTFTDVAVNNSCLALAARVERSEAGSLIVALMATDSETHGEADKRRHH